MRRNWRILSFLLVAFVGGFLAGHLLLFSVWQCLVAALSLFLLGVWIVISVLDIPLPVLDIPLVGVALVALFGFLVWFLFVHAPPHDPQMYTPRLDHPDLAPGRPISVFITILPVVPYAVYSISGLVLGR